MNLNFKLSNEDADKYISDMLHNISETLLKKAREYVRNEDRMHNFNVASLLTSKTREECLDGMRLKHVVSSKDIIHDINYEQKLPSLELLNEKYTDILNYYLLEYMSLRNKIDNLNTINNESKNSPS
jgi:hypothetical protein